MFKRIFSLFFALFIIASLWTANKTPLFLEFSDRFELYLFSPSSTATMVYTDSLGYRAYNGVTGESCVVNDDISAQEIMDKFKAKLLFTETTETGVNYYCYSNKIKYQKTIKGQTVNLQISVTDTQTKIGAPLIFGSF